MRLSLHSTNTPSVGLHVLTVAAACCLSLTGCMSVGGSMLSDGGSSCSTCPTTMPAIVLPALPVGGHCGLGGGRTGCTSDITQCCMTDNCDVPRELRKTSLPIYRIEPPDILLIEAVNNLRPEYAPVHAGEPLLIQVSRTIPVSREEESVSRQFKQINGLYMIGTDGYVDLGPEYGKVLVAEQPIAEIQRRVEAHMQKLLRQSQVLVTLPMPQNQQYVAGQHLVRPDGTVHLGIYGSVYVTGMTLDQAKQAIEQHLYQHIHNPVVSVDVLAYNSKKYYVITDGGGAGEQVFPMPSMGNETVLDAIGNIRGLPTVASKGDIWIARPAPGDCRPDQILKIDWNAIAQGGQTATNYQILPGDRIYVKADKLIRFDTAVAKLTAPFERILGFTILGNGTVRTLSLGRRAFGQGNNAGGGGF